MSRSVTKAIRDGVAAFLAGQTKRVQRADAEKVVRKIVAALQKSHHLEVCGSFRRGRETVGDLDVIVEVELYKLAVQRVINECERLLDGIIASGPTKVSGRLDGIQVDFRFFDSESFGAGSLYFTGSKEFNIQMRKLAIDQGMKLNEFGLWRGEERVAGRTEQSVFDALGMDWVDPKEREE